MTDEPPKTDDCVLEKDGTPSCAKLVERTKSIPFEYCPREQLESELKHLENVATFLEDNLAKNVQMRKMEIKHWILSELPEEKKKLVQEIGQIDPDVESKKIYTDPEIKPVGYYKNGIAELKKIIAPIKDAVAKQVSRDEQKKNRPPPHEYGTEHKEQRMQEILEEELDAVRKLECREKILSLTFDLNRATEFFFDNFAKVLSNDSRLIRNMLVEAKILRDPAKDAENAEREWRHEEKLRQQEEDHRRAKEQEKLLAEEEHQRQLEYKQSPEHLEKLQLEKEQEKQREVLWKTAEKEIRDSDDDIIRKGLAKRDETGKFTFLRPGEAGHEQPVEKPRKEKKRREPVTRLDPTNQDKKDPFDAYQKRLSRLWKSAPKVV